MAAQQHPYPTYTYWQILIFGIFSVGIFNAWWIFQVGRTLRANGAKNLPSPAISLAPLASVALYIMLVETIYRLYPVAAGPLLGIALLLFIASFILLIIWMRSFAREVAWASHFSLQPKQIFITWIFWGLPTLGIAWTAWLYLHLRHPLGIAALQADLTKNNK